MRDLRAEVRRRLEGSRIEPTRQMEIVEEIGQDLEEKRAELLSRGLSADEADTQVVTELAGHEVLARELARVEATFRPMPAAGAPGGSLLRDLGQDLRFALRSFAKSPAFTAITLLSLALGIGATTAIFQLLDAVHYRPLPVAEPGQLAQVKIADRTFASGAFYSWHADLTNPMWERLRDGQEGFQNILAFGDGDFNLSPSGEARRAIGLFVSGAYFATLGVPPALGRVFTAADDRRGCGAAPGAVLGYGFWQREMGGDPGAVGKRISLDGHDVEVIGVAPAGFAGLEVGRPFDVAVPICMDDMFRGAQGRLDTRHAYWLSAVGRLRPGWTIERAGAQLDAISKGIFDATVPPQYSPDSAEKYRAYRLGAFPAATGISALRAEYSDPLYLLLGTAGLVLLIACANLANLYLARASRREHEIATRLALGASRGRLLRQLMTESVLLAFLGAAAGLLVASGLSRLLVAFLATRYRSPTVDLAPDWRVLAFTGGLATLTCILFGLAPALRASRTDVGLVLKATGGHGATVARFGLRRLLVAAQVALSFVLLVAALLFGRSLSKLVSVAPGFDEHGVITVEADLRKMALAPERIAGARAELLDHLRSAPGIAAAASASMIPISGEGWNYQVSDDAKEHEDKGVNTYFSRVSPGYFATLAIPMLAGRDFGAEDKLGGPVTGVVNETLAHKLWPNESPIGHRLYVGASSSGPQWTIDIVGLVRDTKYGDLEEANLPLAYLASTQEKDQGPYLSLVVRSAGPKTDAVGALKRTVAEMSPSIGLDIGSLEEYIHDSLVLPRLTATLSGFFGLLAAILATVGLYGVVAYGVARRTHEIGIRMALGADRARIARMIVRETATLVVIGLVVGTVLALAATRAAASLLYGLDANDPPTFIVAGLVLAAATLLAAALPARRAAGVEPMRALRSE